MRYFLFREDKRYAVLPNAINWYQDTGIFKWGKEQYNSLPKRMLLMVKGGKHTVYTDLLFRPIPLVRELVKSVLELYEPNLMFTECILMNQQEKRTEEYYIPLLPVIESRVLHKDNLTRVVIKKEDVQDRVIFHGGDIKNYYSVIIRMDAAESILRRHAVGFELEEVLVEGGDGTWQEAEKMII